MAPIAHTWPHLAHYYVAFQQVVRVLPKPINGTFAEQKKPIQPQIQT
jgi:hypothetical protein